jgi:lipopolysaccharide/colanic/teichoic acid biosynthesis glycosyltransferase
MIYRRYGKRLLDIAGAAAGLILLAPLLAGIALAVKCGSRGPVFFRQERIGRVGETFKMWKFRSMITGADTVGPLITAAGDSRVNGIGRYLRRWKLDELPQLWNVLCGDMSLVGPRPELPLYVRDYTPAQRQVFMVRPGITDPASLQYRNEEDILAAAVDRESFYKKVVLPRKLVLNLDYIQSFSLRLDLALILRTLKAIFCPATRTKS